MGNRLRILSIALVLIGTALTVFALPIPALAAVTSADVNDNLFVYKNENGTDIVNIYSVNAPARTDGITPIVQNGKTYNFAGFGGTMKTSTIDGFQHQVTLDGNGVPTTLKGQIFRFTQRDPNTNIITGQTSFSSSGGIGVSTNSGVFRPVQRVGVNFTSGPNGVTAQVGATEQFGANLLTGRESNPNPSASAANTDPFYGCTIWDGMSGMMKCLAGFVYYTVIMPIQFIFSVVANLFDWVLHFTIERTTYENPQIKIGWLAVRDVINITFIFALLWHALGLIVGAPGRDNKHLMNIIIAAIFINFSWFIVAQLINLSNTASMALYNTINGNAGDSIASGFASALGFGTLVANENIITLINTNPGNAILLMFAGAALMIILGTILLFSVALFVGRYVVLTILAILSPLMFLGFIFPGFQGSVKKDFWESLRGQLLFPIAYFAMLWISFNVVHEAARKVGNKDWGHLLQLSPNEAVGAFTEQLFTMLWLFAICVAFLVGSLIVAKKFAFIGSSYVGAIQKKTGSLVGGLIFGAPAYVARQTAGGLGRAAALKGINMQGSKSRITQFAGRRLAGIGDRAQKASFDVRGAASILPQAAGMAGEAGGKGGYEASRAAEVDKFGKQFDEQRKRLKELNDSELGRIDEAHGKKREKIKLLEDSFATTHGGGDSLKDVEGKVEKIKQDKDLRQSEHKNAQADATTAKEELHAQLASERTRVEGVLAANNRDAVAKRQLAVLNKLQGKGKGGGFNATEMRDLGDLATRAGGTASATLRDVTTKVRAESDAKKALSDENRKLFAEQRKIAAHKRDVWDAEQEAEKAEKAVKKEAKERVKQFDARMERHSTDYREKETALEARRAALRRYREEDGNKGKK